MQNPPDHFLLVCETCKGASSCGALLAKLSNRLPDGFELTTVRCMAGCDRPTTVGFQAKNKAQYLFGDIASDADIAALVEFAAQYRASETGWTNATDRPLQLAQKTLSRMPRIEVDT